MSDTPVKLHLGCGEKYLEGYVNIDYPASEHSVMTVKADEYRDIRKLSYPENSVSEIRSHHLFEHFNRAEALALVMRWRRWLRPGGKLVIETPDFYSCALAYVFAPTQKRRMELGRHMLGSQEAGWAIHYDFWDAAKYGYVLKKAGFRKIKATTYQNAVAQHLPKVPLMNLFGNLLPPSFYKKRGGHKMPNIVVTAEKKEGQFNRSDEEKMTREILSKYLLGREGESLFSVWMKDFKAVLDQP